VPRLIDAVRAAGFDLDGTLIDTVPDLACAANATLAALGMRTLPETDFPAFVGAGVEQLVLRALEASAGRAPGPTALAQASTLFRAHYRQQLFRRSRVYPGVAGGLHALAVAGLQLCCVTNKAAEFAVPLLESAGLRQYFALILTPGHEAERKPSPALLLSACERLRIGPPQLLYIGDSRTDIVAARTAGCRTASVSYGYNSPDVLAQLKPDAIIASLADLPALQLPA